MNRYYAPNDIILFDSVITNTGNHYSGDKSTFVCPFNGVFSFSVPFYSGIFGYLHLEIMRDDEQIIRGYADYLGSEASLKSHGTSTVVIECNAGQLVWSRCASTSAFMYADGNRESHFTGFALHRFS